MSMKNRQTIRSRKRDTPPSISKSVEIAETLAYHRTEQFVQDTLKKQRRLERKFAEICWQAERREARLRKLRRQRYYMSAAEGHNHKKRKADR